MYMVGLSLVQSVRLHLEGVDDGLDVRLHSFVGELGAGQSTHALQSQVAQVGLSVLQELAQLITGSHQQVGLTANRKQNFTVSLGKLSSAEDTVEVLHRIKHC